MPIFERGSQRISVKPNKDSMSSSIDKGMAVSSKPEPVQELRDREVDDPPSLQNAQNEQTLGENSHKHRKTLGEVEP